MTAKKSRAFSLSIRLFLRRMLSLFRHPVFIALTVFGNLVILSSAFALYHLEHGVNSQIKSLLDTIWWATSTVTTVGYGDVIPITPSGRILGVFTMIVGTALFWSYTALFAEALLSKEIFDLEYELKSVQKLLSGVKQSDVRNQEETKKLIESLELEVQNLKKSLLND